MKKLSTALATLAAMILLPISVSAAAPSITIPVDTIVRGDAGSTHELESVDVEEQYVGMVCEVTATAENQSSVHPGNDLVIASGDSTVTLENVERESNGLTAAEGELTLGNELIVSLMLGDDKVFSGGMNVELDCEQPPVEIEVCRDGVVIQIKEDERLETDTDVPCPVVKIKVCRDGDVVIIKEDDRIETDTELPCPVPEVVEVCRDGKVITSLKSELRDTDTDAPCPKVLGKKTLPDTGASDVAVIVAATAVLGTVAHAVFTKKRLS